MPIDDARKKLLAEYAVALVAERASWERLSDRQQSQAERSRGLAHWKATAARVKTVAQQLRDAAPRPLQGSQDGPDSARPGADGSVALLKAAGGQDIVVSAAAPGWPHPDRSRLPAYLPWLIESFRLIVAKRLARETDPEEDVSASRSKTAMQPTRL